MTNRKKNDALANEKTESNGGQKESITTNAPILRARRAFLTLALASVGTAFLGGEVGCVRGKWGTRREKKNVAMNRLSQTETALRVDGRVERMEIAKNSKRILVKLRDFDDFAEDAYSDFFASGGVRNESEASSDGAGLELWNVEFLEARRETFDVVGSVESEEFVESGEFVESATFDEAGTRVFWTTREIERNGAFAASARGGAGSVRNASSAGFRGFSTANDERTGKFRVGETGVASASANVAANVAADKANWGVRSASYREANVFEPTTRVVLATRAFEGASAASTLETERENATRLKISEAAKGAESVWLSPNARWLVGRAGQVAEIGTTSENGAVARNSEDLAAGEWTLTLRRDRRRVVRFPKSVKMTFAESTSNETIEGRVVDVLSVSPLGDLVATLVEENAPKEISAASGEEGETGAASGEGLETEANVADVLTNEAEFSGRSDFIPRFKMVIWDLTVAETVDWEKAKKPLQALEVAQIAAAGPVSRRFCRFSPNGQIFASRIDPRYVSLWQSANGRLLVELGEHESDVSDFAFSPNGMKIAAATGTGTRVLLWNVRKGAAHRTLQETSPDVASVDAVAFSSDGGTVYFANDLGEIKRWDVRSEYRDATEAEKD